MSPSLRIHAPTIRSEAGYDHVKHPLAHAPATGDTDAETKTRELLDAVQRFAKMR
jgi:hypothetical protein